MQKRFKLMYGVFILLIGVNYLTEYVSIAMREELYGVHAADDAGDEEDAAASEYDPPLASEDGVYFSQWDIAYDAVEYESYAGSIQPATEGDRIVPDGFEIAQTLTVQNEDGRDVFMWKDSEYDNYVFVKR